VVKYVGDATPDKVFIDSELIRSAPVALNRSGLGDILSCHTGLFDWRLAANAGLEPKWNEALAMETRKRLALILDNAAEIRDVSDKGVTLLAETLNWVGHHCYIQGHPRFEEGSEHHVIYNLEYITGKHFIHGQAVCLGIYLMSILQHNEPERMLETIREAGIDITPESLGVTWEDIKKTLDTLTEFVRLEKLPYTILHEKEIPASLLEKVKKTLTE
jgi:glycerol dehydrogenase-like iron-containing ADH family enzyme